MPVSYSVKTQGCVYNVTMDTHCLIQNMNSGTINYSLLTKNEHIDEIKKLPLYEYTKAVPALLKGHYALPDIQFFIKYLPDCKNWILDNYYEYVTEAVRSEEHRRRVRTDTPPPPFPIELPTQRPAQVPTQLPAQRLTQLPTHPTQLPAHHIELPPPPPVTPPPPPPPPITSPPRNRPLEITHRLDNNTMLRMNFFSFAEF